MIIKNSKSEQPCTFHGVSRFYVRVDKDTDRKLRYNGFCSKCNKNTDHRFHGGTITKNIFIKWSVKPTHRFSVQPV